jgi:DNA repair exonuclease SbcCD nuclease subunit
MIEDGRSVESGPVIARFSELTADRPTRIAILSDLHLSEDEFGTARVLHRTRDRLNAVVESLNGQRLDGVLFNGDLVQNGTVAEFDAFDRAVKTLECPLYAIPGNHDLIERKETSGTQLTLSEFEHRYTPSSLPYRERVGGIDLIGLSSNASERGELTTSYRGRVSERSLDWLETTLGDVDSPLVAVHHTLDLVRNRYLTEQKRLPLENGGCPEFENAGAVADVLADAGEQIIFSGHLHVPTLVQTDTLSEFTLPPLGPYPCGYTILDIDADGTTATFHAVTNHELQAEALGYGLESDRVLLAATHMSKLLLGDK